MVIRDFFLFKLPYFKRFVAMTWEPNIYYNPRIVDELPDIIRLHEEVHIEQQKRVGRKLFLLIYILKWICNLFKYGFTMKAYYAIDWELEAYQKTTPGHLERLGYWDLERMR